MIQFQTSLAAAAFAVAGTSALAQADDTQCPIPVPPDEMLWETFLCGQVMVPEDWTSEQGRPIDISYIVFKSTSLAPFEGAVIDFQGGPGGSAVNSLSIIGGGTQALHTNRDIIIVEQQGTAHSTNLFCPLDVRVPSPDTYDEDIAAADARINELKINAYTDPDQVHEMIAAYAEVKDYRGCVPYLEDQGLDLKQYNTANTVRDLIRLMKHLDYPSYNHLGGSYGTTVTLAIMDHYANHPDDDLRPLRSAVIDGVAPRKKEFYEEAFITPYVILRVLESCREDPVCDNAYPDIRKPAQCSCWKSFRLPNCPARTAPKLPSKAYPR